MREDAQVDPAPESAGFLGRFPRLPLKHLIVGPAVALEEKASDLRRAGIERVGGPALRHFLLSECNLRVADLDVGGCEQVHQRRMAADSTGNKPEEHVLHLETALVTVDKPEPGDQ